MIALLFLLAGGSVGTAPVGDTSADHHCKPGHEWSRLHGCLQCPLGNFGSGFSFCQMCPPGTFAGKRGMSTCESCPAGRFGYGASKSSACSGPCKLGHYGGAGSVTNKCSGPCKAGHWGGKGASTELCSGFCPLGKFSEKGAKKCSRCAVGRFCPVPGCGKCLLCPQGKYAQGLGKKGCTTCPPGTSSKRGSGDNNDCKPCAGKGGARMYGGGCPGALGMCPAGKFGSPGSAICKSCPIGEYQFYPRRDHCEACPKGRFAQKPGSRVCGNCPQGLWLHGRAQHARCMPCPSGTYASKKSVKPCIACPAGKFSHTGSRGCKLCPAGQFGNGASYSSFCSGACAPGRWGKKGEMHRMCSGKCEAGRYGNAGQEKSSCSKRCPRGKFNPAGGSACKNCKAGQHAGPGSAFCRTCPVGMFNAQGTIGCAACAKGKTTPEQGSTVCAAITGSPTHAPTPIVPTPLPTQAPTPPTAAPTPRPTPIGTQALVVVRATATLSGPTIVALQSDEELAMSIKRAFSAGVAEALGVQENDVELLKTTSNSSGMHIAFKAYFTNDCPPSNTFCFRKTHPHYKQHVVAIVNGSAFQEFLRRLLRKHGVDLSAQELVVSKPHAVSYMDVQKTEPAPTPSPTSTPLPAPRRATGLAPPPSDRSGLDSYDAAVEVSAAFLGVLGMAAGVAAWKEKSRDDARVVASAEEERSFADAEESTMFEVHGREKTASGGGATCNEM